MIGILAALFFAAFTSATLLPGSSELVLTGAIVNGSAPVSLLILIATIGNTLGSCVNWTIGRFLAQFRDRKWFPISSDQFDKYSASYRRWGVWSLMASWVPIIGDPLTVVAGIARTPFPIFVAIVFVAKAARYMTIAGALTLVW